MGYKEDCFIQKLKTIFPDIVADSPIAGGSSNRRPDGLLRLETYAIVIEIDEGEHEYYLPQNETKRLKEIFYDLKEKPLVVIRLNPDWYVSKGKHTKGCFSSRSKIVNRREFSRRYSKLVRTIRSYIQQPPQSRDRQEDITIVYLFFSRPYPRRQALQQLMHVAGPEINISDLLNEYEIIARHLQDQEE